MKLDEIVRQAEEGSDSSLKERILRFFNDHPDEVFRKREVVSALKGEGKSPQSERALIWKLYTEGRIDRWTRKSLTGSEIGYYGTKSAVDELRRRLSQ